MLAHGQWFSSGTPASSTTKTGRHDIAEILMKVALSTKKQTNKHITVVNDVYAFVYQKMLNTKRYFVSRWYFEMHLKNYLLNNVKFNIYLDVFYCLLENIKKYCVGTISWFTENIHHFSSSGPKVSVRYCTTITCHYPVNFLHSIYIFYPENHMTKWNFAGPFGWLVL